MTDAFPKKFIPEINMFFSDLSNSSHEKRNVASYKERKDVFNK
jgi:hypothetical protein